MKNKCYPILLALSVLGVFIGLIYVTQKAKPGPLEREEERKIELNQLCIDHHIHDELTLAELCYGKEHSIKYMEVYIQALKGEGPVAMMVENPKYRFIEIAHNRGTGMRRFMQRQINPNNYRLEPVE